MIPGLERELPSPSPLLSFSALFSSTCEICILFTIGEMTCIGQKENGWPWKTGTARTSLATITASTTLTIVTGASTRTMWLTGQRPPLACSRGRPLFFQCLSDS